MRYLLTITYYGKDFFGWQKQKNKRTIQEEIEKGLEILLKENIDLVGSGRTDSVAIKMSFLLISINSTISSSTTN